MDNVSFYPTLSPDMLELAGITSGDYEFTFEYQKNLYKLKQKDGLHVKLVDPMNIWNIETEGLILDKTVSIAYPDLLKGPDGIVCQEAEFGIYIIWTNKKLTQTGIITPIADDSSAEGRICKFHYRFDPGKISGDLQLSVSLYVRKPAKSVLNGEENLINEAGAEIGEIERKVLDFSNIYMDFPIDEFKSDSEPLWWVEFSEWEDPKTVDMFTKDSFCLYLNPYYDACPTPAIDENSVDVNNFDLLVDILAQTYLMIFQRLSAEDLKAAKQDINLTNDSICSILHQFIEDCYEELHWESPEKLLKSLQINIRKMLSED